MFNFVSAMLCVSWSLRWDERAANILLVEVPVFTVFVLGDATVSQLDFDLRWFSLLIMAAWAISGTWQRIQSTQALTNALSPLPRRPSRFPSQCSYWT